MLLWTNMISIDMKLERYLTNCAVTLPTSFHLHFKLFYWHVNTSIFNCGKAFSPKLFERVKFLIICDLQKEKREKVSTHKLSFRIMFVFHLFPSKLSQKSFFPGRVSARMKKNVSCQIPFLIQLRNNCGRQKMFRLTLVARARGRGLRKCRLFGYE